MELITRQEAIAQKLTKYFTGKPCKYGHVSERFTISRVCVFCTKIREDNYYEKNKESVKAKVNARYHSGDKKLYAEKCRDWERRNPEKIRASRNKWDKNNKGIRAANLADYKLKKLQRTPKWADPEKIKNIYLECDALNKSSGKLHQVDHIVPIRGKNVCGLHVENNLQILPKLDNLKKGNKFEVD